MSESLVKNIEAFAKLRGESLRQVGINAGVGETSIYKWEKHDPNLGSVKKVAKYLGVDYKILLP